MRERHHLAATRQRPVRSGNVSPGGSLPIVAQPGKRGGGAHEITKTKFAADRVAKALGRHQTAKLATSEGSRPRARPLRGGGWAASGALGCARAGKRGWAGRTWPANPTSAASADRARANAQRCQPRKALSSAEFEPSLLGEVLFFRSLRPHIL